MIQETKLTRCDIADIEGFKCFHKVRGSSCLGGGLSILVKEKLIENKRIEFVESEDYHVMWLKISKDILDLDKNVYLGNVYLPPEGSKYADYDNFLEVEGECLDICNKEEAYLMLAGDFNAHTGILSDLVVFDKFSTADNLDELNEIVFSYDNLRDLGINLTRNSECKQKVNNYGNRFLELCKGLDLMIANGRLGQDSGVGRCTFKDVAVDDYLIANPRLLPLIEDFNICEFDPLFSDGHSALEFSLKTVNLACQEKSKCTHEGVCNQIGFKKLYGKWDPDKAPTFLENLDLNLLHSINEELDGILSKESCIKDDIDHITNLVNEVLLTAAKETCPAPKASERVTHTQNKTKNCNVCRQLKRDYTSSQNRFN